MGYLEAINRRLSSPTFIIIGKEGGRGSRICAHSFQFYSTRSRPFHTQGRGRIRGIESARFQLSRLKSSAVRALSRLFNRYLSFTVHDSRNAYECDGPACIIYRTRPDRALCPKMDGIIRVCAAACSSKSLHQEPSPVGISIVIRDEIRDQPGSLSKMTVFSTGQKWPVLRYSYSDNRIVSPPVNFYSFSSHRG